MSEAQFTILIVEDDRAMRQSLVDLLESAGWQVEAVPRADAAENHLKNHRPDVVLSDMRMPGRSGLDLLKSLDAPHPPVVLISAHGDIPMAVEAMQAGAYSFVEKPYDPRRLLSILQHAAEQNRMQQDNARLKDRLRRLSGLDRLLIGNTPEIVALRQQILDLADIHAPILIRGETGTGKDIVANALHDLSTTSEGTFLALNCAALSADSFEAEMFGVAAGADGRLVAIRDGTLFLDELCACPPAIQSKLLRVIEDKQVLPVGATTPRKVAFRVISATNEDIEKAVAEKRLREDLLYRLNTMELTLPPLRQRRDDLGLLATHFLGSFARAYETDIPEMTPEDMAVLMSHDWRGNVRELRNACERRILQQHRGSGGFAAAIRTDDQTLAVPNTLREAVAAFERELIGKAIRQHDGRMDDTATALGIGRRTLNEKIVKLGLDKDALL